MLYARHIAILIGANYCDINPDRSWAAQIGICIEFLHILLLLLWPIEKYETLLKVFNSFALSSLIKFYFKRTPITHFEKMINKKWTLWFFLSPIKWLAILYDKIQKFSYLLNIIFLAVFLLTGYGVSYMAIILLHLAGYFDIYIPIQAEYDFKWTKYHDYIRILFFCVTIALIVLNIFGSEIVKIILKVAICFASINAVVLYTDLIGLTSFNTSQLIANNLVIYDHTGSLSDGVIVLTMILAYLKQLKETRKGGKKYYVQFLIFCCFVVHVIYLLQS